MTWLLVALAGGLGAVSRYLVDVATQRITDARWSTVAVNVTGSFAAGLIAGLAVSSDVEVVVAGGFLGAYTTFSTAMMLAATDLLEGRTLRAVADLATTLAVTVLAAAAGVALTS